LDRRVRLGARQFLRQPREHCRDDPVRRLARVGASARLQLACGERRLACRLRRVPRARSRGGVLGLRHREVAADPSRALPVGRALVGRVRWGDLPLTWLLCLVGMAASIPIGILLALARRSDLPLLRSMASLYIELVRGVPLITVLFTASFVFPLLLPQGIRLD